MHCVIETSDYLRSAKEAGLSDEDRHRITLFLSENPESGDLIQGTGGARKIRFPFRDRGKSGGIRVITFFVGADIPVFLLDVFSKGQRIDLTQAERNELRQILSDLADSYREMMRDKIADLARSKEA